MSMTRCKESSSRRAGKEQGKADKKMLSVIVGCNNYNAIHDKLL
jgi:hypothetical protein